MTLEWRNEPSWRTPEVSYLSDIRTSDSRHELSFPAADTLEPKIVSRTASNSALGNWLQYFLLVSCVLVA